MALSHPGDLPEAGGMDDSTTRPGRAPQRIHLAEQPVAVVRGRVPMTSLPDFFGRAFGTVMAAVRRQGAGSSGPPFARYFGMPGESVDVEAGFPVEGSFTAADGALSGALPETDGVEALHVGPYDTLGQTYDAIRQFMAAEGLVPAGNMWEYYLSDPDKEPDPAAWQTRVVWPVSADPSR